MPTPEELKNQARAKARSILSQSQSFLNMDKAQQFALYKDVVNSTHEELVRQNELAKGMSVTNDEEGIQSKNNQLARQAEFVSAMATAPNPNSNPDNITQAGNNFANLVDKVDFPGFVRDLLVGVFDANLDANERQMEAYTKLLKEATKGVNEFAKDVTDMDALIKMVETSGGYSLGPPNLGGDGLPTLIDTTTKQPVDTNNNSIQAKIIEAKMALAKEKRTMLRETILMGVSRLVVEKGIIRAEVEFQINASATTNDTSNDTKTSNTSVGGSARVGGKVGAWGAEASTNFSRTSSQVSIATSNATTKTDASAKLKGFVEIQFKSDYFKLDNFTQIFDLGKGQVPQGANPQPNQAQAPASQP
ncbi:hypothetical protein H6G33_31170 [Calothrix sp. FACHB-1219]|uniref:hypothetical protein n=1 Tax=unclassified Calothrix TaxID=2619626 RepID=UPI001688E480|nr:MULTISPECIES: hypothetical protein [unclassified Calothrix]MBD2206937.1 hypothetical protein [Calothrix sp. FACHB-168]MBD2221435.1 hypothetical protein [Calothrix sp. FACHB-1219]